MASTKYLSFNPSVADAINLDECITEERPADAPMPLQHRWHVWEQIQREAAAADRAADYSQNTRDLASFDTVQTFWQLWAHIPQPSELLGHKRMIRQDSSGKSHVVDALMIFREGIQPMWEDPQNCVGGHLEYRIVPFQTRAGQLGEYWNNLVLGLIGGTIEHGSHVTGIRLVDKLGQGRHPCIRIEVWVGKGDRTVQEKLAKDLEKCFATKLDGSIGTAPRGDWKSHSTR
uniref:Uncharacterized protein n=1 Tax=Eimeria tenella TaxID=5802 RepID=H9B9V7_EIMTE|nr:hypothetical protein [Eimeria tenella]